MGLTFTETWKGSLQKLTWLVLIPARKRIKSEITGDKKSHSQLSSSIYHPHYCLNAFVCLTCLTTFLLPFWSLHQLHFNTDRRQKRQESGSDIQGLHDTFKCEIVSFFLMPYLVKLDQIELDPSSSPCFVRHLLVETYANCYQQLVSRALANFIQIIIYIWACHSDFPHHLTSAALEGVDGVGDGGEFPWVAHVTSLLTILTSVESKSTKSEWKKVLWNISHVVMLAVITLSSEKISLLIN